MMWWITAYIPMVIFRADEVLDMNPFYVKYKLI